MSWGRNTFQALERWLRIDPDGPPEKLTRSRAVYVVGVVMIALQALNAIAIWVSYGGWHQDVVVAGLTAAVIFASIVILRWSKNFEGFAVFYIILTVTAVGASALADGGGIDTSLIPYLIIGPVIVGYLSDWRFSLVFSGIAATLLVVFFLVSESAVAPGNTETSISHFQRLLQAELGLMLATVVAVNFSINAYGSLATQRKNLERAQKAEAAKSEFLATMSHELRTPLNGVIGMAEALCACQLGPREREFAQTIRRSGESLLVIIGDLLDLSKIEAGKLEIESRPFSLPDLVRHTVDTWTEAVASKGLLITTKIYSDVPNAVLGDEHRIGQILHNLISNAVKFTDEGNVTVELSCDQTAGSPVFLFRVTDTGTGIPDERREDIFEVFAQAESGTTRRFGGTGLGLPICRLLAGLMGGTIDIEDTSEDGTTFLLSIPMETTEQVKPAARTSKLTTSAKLQGLRVLVAEDNEINRMVMQEFLRAWGTEFVFAEDGPSALEALDTGSFDILLLDKHMPGMSGLDVAVKIRHMEGPHRNIPIIAISADTLPEEVDDALAAGMDDFVPKPVKPDILRQTMEEVIERNTFAMEEAAEG